MSHSYAKVYRWSPGWKPCKSGPHCGLENECIRPRAIISGPGADRPLSPLLPRRVNCLPTLLFPLARARHLLLHHILRDPLATLDRSADATSPHSSNRRLQFRQLTLRSSCSIPFRPAPFQGQSVYSTLRFTAHRTTCLPLPHFLHLPVSPFVLTTSRSIIEDSSSP